ncbi:MAG: hemerythrin domain-containing protein [Burkholderiaceae bacterium]|nr:hemerythrin domain-containing protein [Burkholderiaceae bacterium]
MSHAALKIIHDEHAALAVLLRTMGVLLAAYRKHGTRPDFGLLRAMLFYVDEFPERLHHAKESALLFPRLRERAPELGPVLERLDRDHARGSAAVRDLAHALLGFELMGEARRIAFEQALDEFVASRLEHMRVEETEILPVAEKLLEPEDWAALDAAFRENRDPLTGHAPEDDYRELFSRIVRQVPAPFGLGPAL